MSRTLIVAAAQTGPVARSESRTAVVRRLIALLRTAHGRGARLVVFPELALTTFFPRWWMEDQAEIDAFFEREMPGPETRPLFEEAQRLGVGFYLGYAELAEQDGRSRRFNTSILVDPAGRIVGRYRKVHLPGHSDHLPGRPTSTWRRNTSSRAISAFRSGARWMPISACASATTAAGRRPTGSWDSRRWNWSWSATTRRFPR